MRILQCLFFSAAVFCSLTQAQTFEWVNASPLDIQTNPAYLHSPVTIDDASSPVSARMVNFRELYSTAYYGDVEIQKRSSAGALIWSDTVYGKADVSEIITDGNGNVICTGTFLDTLKVGPEMLVHSGSDPGYFILKLDGSGGFQWLRDGSLYITGFAVITALSADGPDHIIIGTSDYPVVSKIITLDADGNVVSVIEEENAGTISDVSRDINGNTWATGFAFSGSLSFNGFDTTAVFPYNEYVVKYDPSGTAVWVSFIQDVTVQDYNIKTDNAGNAYLSGNLLDSTSFGSLHAEGPQWLYDYFVTRIDPSGNYVWLKEIPPGNPAGDASLGSDNFLSCRSDGYTFITGIFRGTLDLGNGFVLNPIDYSDLFAACYSPDGEIRWAKSAGSGDYDQGSAIIADENGSCYLTGMTGQNYMFDTVSGTGGYRNLYLAKLKFEDASGTGDGSLQMEFSARDFSLFQNYPNPFNPSTKLSYELSRPSFVSLKVYDVLGNEVASLVDEQKPAGSYSVQFDGSSLSSGVYFYKLTAGSFVEVRKMMLLR